MGRRPSTAVRLTAGGFWLGVCSKRWSRASRQANTLQIHFVRSGETPTTTMARPAEDDPESTDAGGGWTLTGWRNSVEARHSLQRIRRADKSQKHDETANANAIAFEASAPSHGWPRVRGCP
jgi:poly(3-hydroxybutyrate) depolymerase